MYATVIIQCVHPMLSTFLLSKRKARVKLAPSTIGSDSTTQLFRRVTETVPLTTVPTSQDSPSGGAKVDSCPDLYIEQVYRDPCCRPRTQVWANDVNPDTADAPSGPASSTQK